MQRSAFPNALFICAFSGNCVRLPESLEGAQYPRGTWGWDVRLGLGMVPCCAELTPSSLTLPHLSCHLEATSPPAEEVGLQRHLTGFEQHLNHVYPVSHFLRTARAQCWLYGQYGLIVERLETHKRVNNTYIHQRGHCQCQGPLVSFQHIQR